MSKLGFNQSSLAKELNTSQSTIARWLGGAKPQPRILKELANVLCVRMRWLVDGEEPMELDEIRTALTRNNPKGTRINSVREADVPYAVRSKLDDEALMQQEISQVHEAITLHDEIERRLFGLIANQVSAESATMQTLTRRIDEWREICGSLSPRGAQTLVEELAKRAIKH